ncbi:hypothetical protein GCM10027035_15990 [Emticicia sediminis]
MALAQEVKPIKVISTNLIRNVLQKVALERNFALAKSQAIASGISISLPTPNGTDVIISPIESPVMSEELSQRFPLIKTYRLFSRDVKEQITGVLTISPEGINALLFTNEGNVIISPSNVKNDEYFVFFQNDNELKEVCEISDEHIERFGSKNRVKSIQDFTNGTTLRSYRMAIATTGEFYTNNGSTQTSAQAAVVSMVNSLRAVYEKEVAITFSLVATKIYDNSATDPFNPSSGSKALDAAVAFGSLSSSEPASFALNLYDIGHVIHHSPGGGGVAYLNGPCNNFNLTTSTSPIKAGGWSGGTTTTLATFIHEVGHQFSAGHTFNSVNNGCNGNIMTGSAYEPGSGSTYMSYWGSCSPDNISGTVNRTYFHANSLESIITFSKNTATCSVNTPTGNNVPVINVNPNGNTLIVPKGTPFRLQGSGTDADGETILFNWEQYNLGTTRGGADDAQNSTTSPIFRSFAPSSTGNIRDFPALSSILTGSVPSNDEALSQVARTINFRLTGRDGRTTGGGGESKTLTLTVDNSGPFLITSQNFTTLWLVGNSANISWSVNGTNTAPINCLNVKISFSTDGGTTFPIVLAASTPNDGSHTITIPNNLTMQGRIKIEPATSGVFFDINDVNIIVTNVCTAEISNITPSTAISATVGGVNLNLSLSSYGTSISNFTGTFTTSSLTSNLSFENPAGACSGPSNSNYYAVHSFQVVTAGTYTFTRTGSGLVMNLYSAAFNPSNVCSNWLASSAKQSTTGGPVSTNSSLTKALTPGIYYIVIETFSTSSPLLPSNYTITPSGGSIYNTAPVAGSPYSYTYLTKNNTSGNITSFTTVADLSNATSYPAGSYTVYGLSYQGGLDLSSYTGTSFTAFQSLLYANTVCGKLSDNSKVVIITPNCANTLSLSGIATNGIQQVNQTITSTQVINSGQNVTYRAGNSITLTPLTASGFSAVNGSVFKAEIGGCN